MGKAEPAKVSYRITRVLCLFVILIEGFDLQSAGVCAPFFRAELGLSVAEMGMVFTGNTLGLFFGAACGGWIADRIGRRLTLIAAVASFGVGSLLTAAAQSTEFFLAVRIFTGVGLGAAMPMILVVAAEAGKPETRGRRVILMSSATPLGGALCALLLLSIPQMPWRDVFLIGGCLPIVLAVVMFALLPETDDFMQARTMPSAGRGSIVSTLFGDGRLMATLLLWTSCFLALISLYLLLNWLPSLALDRGHDSRAATTAALLFGAGGTAGGLLMAFLLQRVRKTRIVYIAYIGMLVGGSLLFFGQQLQTFHLGSLLLGMFVLGAQNLLYGHAPIYYPTDMRGTGVGAAVAAGRLGAIVGPSLGAVVLILGGTSSEVLLALLPVAALGFVASWVLFSRESATPVMPARE